MAVTKARAPIAFDSPMIAAIIGVAAMAVILAIGAVAAVDWRAGVGVAVGGLTATVNLWFFAHIGRNLLAGGRRKRIWGLLAVLKLGALFGGLYVLLVSGVTTGLTLAIGYAAMPFGIVLASVVGPRPGDDDGAHPGDLVTAASTADDADGQSHA
jgi:hypothetical protein